MPDVKQKAIQVEKEVQSQSEQMREIQNNLAQLTVSSETLASTISVAQKELSQFNTDQVTVRSSIQELAVDLGKLANMDTNLKRILKKFELGQRIQAPFDFYLDLERNQRQLVLKLANKVEEAEKIAVQVLKERLEGDDQDQQFEH